MTIWEERDGIFRAPEPRTGEVGVYKLSRCRKRPLTHYCKAYRSPRSL